MGRPRPVPRALSRERRGRASFHDPSFLVDCKTMSDADMGGFSRAHLEWQAPSPSPSSSSSSPSFLQHTLSPVLQPLRIRKIPRHDLDGAARRQAPHPADGVRGMADERPAGDAVRQEPVGHRRVRVPGAAGAQRRAQVLRQRADREHRADGSAPAPAVRARPGEWETVLIKWNEFVRTNHGVVVEPQTELLRRKVRTIGIGLIDRVPGPFELDVERIWATNGLSEEDVREDERAEEGMLKSKHGEKIRWGERKRPVVVVLYHMYKAQAPSQTTLTHLLDRGGN